LANLQQVAFTDPYGDQENEILRRQKMAEMLQAQSLTPTQEKTAGGWVVKTSPFEGLAKVAQGFMGGYGMQDAGEKRKELVKQMQGDASKWYGTQPQGTPAQIQDTSQQGTGSFDMSGSTGPTNVANQAPTRQQMEQWAMQGMNNPYSKPIAQMRLAEIAKQNEAFTLPEGAMRIGADGQIVRENPKDFKPDEKGTWGEPYMMNGSMVQKNSVTGQVKQAVSREPVVRVHQEAPITSVRVIESDPKSPFFGKPVIKDGRSGRTIGLDSGLDVGAQGAKAGAVQGAQAEAKRSFNMSGLGSTIQEAEDLLTGKSGKDLPTGSTVGNIYDTLAGGVGMNPSGAKEAETLKAIGGALVSKMPRMEGPQSDKDVMLYKEMAGRVGDPTVPRERRVAALEKVKELWGKYEKPAPSNAAPQTATGPNGEKLQLVGGKWVPM